MQAAQQISLVASDLRSICASSYATNWLWEGAAGEVARRQKTAFDQELEVCAQTAENSILNIRQWERQVAYARN